MWVVGLWRMRCVMCGAVDIPSIVHRAVLRPFLYTKRDANTSTNNPTYRTPVTGTEPRTLTARAIAQSPARYISYMYRRGVYSPQPRPSCHPFK
jgi:hypothetical protein